MVSEEGLKVWLSTARRLRKQKAAHSDTLSLYQWWGRELLRFHAWGSQCKERQNKKVYSELRSNIQVTTLLLSSPHPRPHTCTYTSRHACLPANTEEVTDLITVLVIFQRKMS